MMRKQSFKTKSSPRKTTKSMKTIINPKKGKSTKRMLSKKNLLLKLKSSKETKETSPLENLWHRPKTTHHKAIRRYSLIYALCSLNTKLALSLKFSRKLISTKRKLMLVFCKWFLTTKKSKKKRKRIYGTNNLNSKLDQLKMSQKTTAHHLHLLKSPIP